ncbi:hypothetical protein BH11VER1_BH11VER1_08920 [soil metagenome]
MKQKSHSDSKTQSGFNADQFRRHYVSAVDTDQAAAWNETESTGYLGRVFMVLLLLHVFLIGAVVLYNVVADKPKADLVESTSNGKKTDAVKKDTVAATKAKPQDSAKPVAPSKTSEMDEYQVRSGDSLKTITDATGVKAEDIIRVNQLDTNGELYVGRKLLLPKKKIEEVAPKAVPVPAPVLPIASATPAKTAVTNTVPVAMNPQEVAPKMVAKPKTVEMAKLQLEQAQPKPVAVKVDGGVKEMLPEEKPKPAVIAESAPPKAKPVMSGSVANTPEAPKVASVKPVSQKADAAATAKPASTKSGGSHAVKQGETFYSIARKYGVGINDLMKVNGYTKAGTLRDGVKLKIPSKN